MDFGIIELIIFAVIALGLGGWQYWSISREIEKDKKKKGEE